MVAQRNSKYNPVQVLTNFHGMCNTVHTSFKHGENFKIGQYNIIEEDVIVGDNVTIENFVLLKKGTIIGDNVFVDSYVKSSGSNKIGNNVTLRYNCTVAKEVTIEDDVFISPNVMTIYSNAAGKKMGGIVIRERAFIGTSAVIGPRLIIERDVKIGAMSYLTKDAIERFGVYTGIPARLRK